MKTIPTMNRLATTLFSTLAALLLGACAVDAQDPEEALVRWDPEAQQCSLGGSPVIVNGASTEAGCGELAESEAAGTLTMSAGASAPSLEPQFALVCAMTCDCSPGGCECGEIVCYRVEP